MERGKRASFLIIFLALQFKTTKQLNSLNGKHLVVSGLSNVRNNNLKWLLNTYVFD